LFEEGYSHMSGHNKLHKSLLKIILYSINILTLTECQHLVVVGGLPASMTLRAMPEGTYVPGRASQAGQVVKEKPD
jgi:hypothetical protein